MKRPATIIDVANRAGVSLGTVSNVLNGRVTVRKETREQVETAIRELGFTPSMIATGMRKQRSNVIGLCVPYTNFQNFSLLADAVERISAAAGYELMQVYSRQDPAVELERIERLLAFRVGGVLLVPSLKPKAAL
jgi:LacI family transcriptional regulator